MTTRTHTRTHVHVTFADPYLICEQCRAWVVGWHNPQRCDPSPTRQFGCGKSATNLPCGHAAGVTSVCPSWSPVGGCHCREHLGHVPHGEPS